MKLTRLLVILGVLAIPAAAFAADQATGGHVAHSLGFCPFGHCPLCP